MARDRDSALNMDGAPEAGSGGGLFYTLARDAQRVAPGRRPAGALLRGMLNPRFHPVLLCRLAQALRWGPLRPLGLMIATVNWLVYRVEVALDTRIGPGLFLPHGNVIIGAYAIGEDCTLFSGVVLGGRAVDLAAAPGQPIGADRPCLGSRVTVYSNAVVAGPVTIGDDVRVAACTLVTRSISAGATVRPMQVE